MSDVEQGGGSHPGVSEYVQIGVILAVLTSIEVGLYLVRDQLVPGVVVPALLLLTVLKFGLVVLWFMHLRFDHRMFRRLFAMGLLLALAVFGVVAAIFYLGGA